jgi:protein-S-isoprenylcysteine O-methyltransferase Ste14
MPTDQKIIPFPGRNAEKSLTEAREILAFASRIDHQKLVRVLSVHHIEPEMQNEQLHVTNNLDTKVWLGLVFLAVATGLLLFLTAGTVRYWQAWAYLAVYFGASFFVTRYRVEKDPALLKPRSGSGPTTEKEKPQQVITIFVSAGCIASLVVPALDHRFGWSSLPVYAIIAGDVLTVLCFYVMFLVFKANTFASAAIGFVEEQKVFSIGPFAFVRHPMYAGGLLLLVGAPLALGSYWGLLALVAVLPALVWRLLGEEKFLANNLPGYVEYCTKVRWRMIPGVF